MSLLSIWVFGIIVRVIRVSWTFRVNVTISGFNFRVIRVVRVY